MDSKTIEVPFVCDMLIDQNVYIGDDAIGRKCSNEATYESSEGVLMCDDCKAMLVNEPHRLTASPIFGKDAQTQQLESFVKLTKAQQFEES